MDARTNDKPPASLQDRVRSLKLTQAKLDPPRRGSKLPWLICLILAVVCSYLGFLVYSDAGNADPNKNPLPVAQHVEFSTVQTDFLPGDVLLDAGGYVIPVFQVQVSPKVGGQVEELFVEEGDFVNKGDPLAQLDNKTYEFELKRATALMNQAKARHDELLKGNRQEEINQAEASLREAEEQVNQFRDELTRLERAAIATSPDELVRARSRLIQMKHKREQLSQAFALMKAGPRQEQIDGAFAEYQHHVAQRDRAQYDLDNCIVTAPVSGVILQKQAEVGDTVLPNVPSNGLSASLCTMADLRNLEVDVDISERDLIRVRKGQKCQIRTEAFPDQVYEGKVSRLMPVAIRSKAAVSARVHIEVPEGDRLLRPEMRARVQFLALKKEDETAEDKQALGGTP